MGKSYGLPQDISRMDLLNTLEHLKDDANDEFTPLARNYTKYGDASDKAKAMYYHGQIELLDRLIWALSGAAEKEGCEPSISIDERKDLS